VWQRVLRLAVGLLASRLLDLCVFLSGAHWCVTRRAEADKQKQQLMASQVPLPDE
jgi:hypothetical protein